MLAQRPPLITLMGVQHCKKTERICALAQGKVLTCCIMLGCCKHVRRTGSLPVVHTCSGDV